MRAPAWLAGTIAGSDTARDVGIFAATILGIVTVVRVLWRGLAALVHAQDIVREQQAALDAQRHIQHSMTRCLNEAQALNKDLSQVEARMERIERFLLDLALKPNDQ